MCRDEDDRILQRSAFSFACSLKTGHSRHPDIRDQASSLVLLAGFRIPPPTQTLVRQTKPLSAGLQCAAH